MKYPQYIIALLALLVIIGCTQPAAVDGGQAATGPVPVVSEKAGTAVKTAPAKQATAPSEPTTHLVEVTMAGFTPATLKVQAGDTVEFKSIKGIHWVASAVHPDHKAYPGSDIGKCNGPEEETTFDACRRVTEGKSYSFTFTEKGSWKFHDHVNPGLVGTIVVE